MKTKLPLLFLFAAALCSTALALTALADPGQPPIVAVLGASASSGFRLGEFLGGDAEGARARIATEIGREPAAAEFDSRTTSIGLAALIAQLRGEGIEPPVDASDKWLFLSPQRAAGRQIEAVLGSDAEVVLAVDLMFWFGYGRLSKHEQKDPTAARLAREQQGLDLLTAMLADKRWGSRKLVVGDYPDCSDASEMLISANMRPDAATLAKLNEALHRWAMRHGKVRVFPLAQLLAEMKSGRATVADGVAVTEADVLQFDRLHPTGFGMTVLVRELAAFVAREFPGLDALVPAERLAARLRQKA